MQSLSLWLSLSLSLSLSLCSPLCLSLSWVLGRQVLYHLSHSTNLVLYWIFSRYSLVNYFTGLALNHEPPDLWLLNSQDYRRKLPVPGPKSLFLSLLAAMEWVVSPSKLPPWHTTSPQFQQQPGQLTIDWNHKPKCGEWIMRQSEFGMAPAAEKWESKMQHSCFS
jgi:hypothetical protein